MVYIKFSSKDTTAIINATDKLINCNPVKSVKVKSIPPELRELCRIVRGQLRSMGYMEYRVEYLRPLIEVMNLFGSFFNFSTSSNIQRAISLYHSYASGSKPIRYKTEQGDSLVYADD
ncbi:hypothetical protein [Bacteroides xylanisolvens]|uniref:hypothetical protein n=1 Tax=Bacteroides xylanisolvens TaxID=371601 RepID=UPI0032C00909